MANTASYVPWNAKSLRWILPAVLVVVISLATSVESLYCLQCVSTSPDGGNCLNDLGGLVNASKEGTKQKSLYRKDCTESNPRFDRCAIETHIGPDDKYVYFHRGCHDGVSFNKKANSSRFQKLATNNETTCAKPPELNVVVCFTFCADDMCNGPFDPCEGYNASDPNRKELPPGTICTGNCFHSNALLLFLSFLATVAMSMYSAAFSGFKT